MDGLYPGNLAEVVEYTKTYEGKETPRYAWVFDVQAGDDALDPDIDIEVDDWKPDGHYEIAAHTGVTKSQKANSNWQKLDMGVLVPDNVRNTDEVLGAPCMLFVSSFVGSDGLTKNTIEKVRKPRKGQKWTKPGEDAPDEPSESSAAESEEEKDFADIPF